MQNLVAHVGRRAAMNTGPISVAHAEPDNRAHAHGSD
jgi:hypothetical protein